jgi:SAM-dependent methyltransferase
VKVLGAAILLRLLLRLDNLLYRWTSRAAVAYGGGRHPKHRLTGYHEFFTTRVRPGDRVLDVGCGEGALARDLLRVPGVTVTGVDHDGAALHAARAGGVDARLTFVEADARRPPAGDYTVVILSNVLEHLEDRPAFLRAIVARTGAGRVLIRVPLFERDWRVPLKRELGVDHRLDADHKTEHTLADFEREVAAGGLVLEECRVRWGEIWAACRTRA